MAYEDLLHWSVIGEYYMLNLIFDYLRSLMLQKLSLLLAKKIGFFE